MKLVAAFAALLIAAQASAEWRIAQDRDPMTDATKAYAISSWTKPTRRISGVYSGLQAVLGFGCDGSNEWAYVKFNEQINSHDAETQQGYNRIKAAVRWDDEKAVKFNGTQDWGSSSFNLKKEHIDKIQRHSTVIFGLSWYTAGEVYVRFDLEGSSDAISKAREACRS